MNSDIENMKELVESYQPNFDIKFADWRNALGNHLHDGAYHFLNVNVNEALIAFADTVEQATKESCAKHAWIERLDSQQSCTVEISQTSILNALSPIKK